MKSARRFSLLPAYQRKLYGFLSCYANIKVCSRELIFLTLCYWVNRTLFLMIFGTKPPQKKHNFIFLPYRKKRYGMQGNTKLREHCSVVEEHKLEVVTFVRYICSYKKRLGNQHPKQIKYLAGPLGGGRGRGRGRNHDGWPFAIRIRESTNISLACKIWPAKHIFVAFRLHKQTVPLSEQHHLFLWWQQQQPGFLYLSHCNVAR